MKKLLLLLSPVLLLSQEQGRGRVGINSPNPKATLHIAPSPSDSIQSKGDLFISHVEDGDLSDYILVWRNGFVKKIPVSLLISQTPKQCPDFVRSQSNQYYLLFKSSSSIENPNDTLIIETRNFSSAGTWIQNNLYYFSYTNTSGSPLNIDSQFIVHFGSQKCIYNK